MKGFNKILLMAGLALLIVLIVGGTIFMFGIKKEKFLEKYSVEPGALLQVYNKTGSISITSWEQDYIEVAAVKQSVLGLFLDQVNIEVKVSDRIVISSEYSNKASLIVGVEYQVRVPEGVLVSQVDNSTGSINVENVAGDVIAQTSSGSINAKNIAGEVSAQTSTGGIEINGVTGLVNAITDNGKISVTKAGGIHKIRTKRGSISVEVSAIQEDLEIGSQSGTITVFLYPGIDAYIKAGTSNGNISYEGLHLTVIELTNNRLIGTMGEGSKNINIKTSSGSIHLRNLSENEQRRIGSKSFSD